jgi:quercetin dioxygenase-like cupin family protein
MDAPLNVDQLDLAELVSESGEAAWTGGYFAYGGNGAQKSTVIYFAIPPGKRLGKHTDTAEETQFILGGSGRILLDAGDKDIRAGDVIVLEEGKVHDLENIGDEDLRVIGFFAADRVEQHWTDESWPGAGNVTKSPNED